jgi:hypothetical protein
MPAPDPTTDHHAVGMDFLRTELQLGATFAELGAGADADAEKRTRERGNAQAAYDAIVKFAPTLVLSAAESKEIEDGLAALKQAIHAIDP